MRVALVYTDAEFYAGAGYERAWIRALTEAGAEVDLLPATPAGWPAGDPVPPRWDLAIAHVLVEEVAAFDPTLRLAALLEATGTPLLNPVTALLASADKLVTHAVWAAHGLPQPAAWELGGLATWPSPGRELVLKPAWGDAARQVALVGSLAQARERVASWTEQDHHHGPAMLQEWVREPRCLRLFATPDEVSLAYEKARDEGELVTHGTRYPHVFEPPTEVAALAQRMVATLGGGLMGVDVLLDAGGGAWALEANAPFGFDVTDPEQGRWVARAALGRVATAAARA